MQKPPLRSTIRDPRSIFAIALYFVSIRGLKSLRKNRRCEAASPYHVKKKSPPLLSVIRYPRSAILLDSCPFASIRGSNSSTLHFCFLLFRFHHLSESVGAARPRRPTGWLKKRHFFFFPSDQWPLTTDLSHAPRISEISASEIIALRRSSRGAVLRSATVTARSPRS